MPRLASPVSNSNLGEDMMQSVQAYRTGVGERLNENVQRGGAGTSQRAAADCLWFASKAIVAPLLTTGAALPGRFRSPPMPPLRDSRRKLIARNGQTSCGRPLRSSGEVCSALSSATKPERESA